MYVINLTWRYYIASEYFKCRSCRGTIISYDSRLLGQLWDAYQVRFSVILNRKYACDRAVIILQRYNLIKNAVLRSSININETGIALY
jgi:hypothetical protein